MVVRVSDKTQNYSKVTKLLVKPKTLKKISVYRKLGIGIKDIQTLLEKDDKSILLRIYQEKLQEKILQDSELEALKQFIDDGNADKANEILDYQTVENAIECRLPNYLNMKVNNLITLSEKVIARV